MRVRRRLHHVPNIGSESLLSQDVMPNGNLANGDEPGRDLPQTEERGESELAESDDPCRPLSYAPKDAQAQLSECDKARRNLADADNADGKSADGNDTFGDNAPTRFGRLAKSNVNQGKSENLDMSPELCVIISVLRQEPTPSSEERIFEFVIDWFEQQISHGPATRAARLPMAEAITRLSAHRLLSALVPA
jgi:hypothetical protein